MTKQDFITWGKSKGWILDSWGHLKKTFPSGTVHRIKFQSRSVRYERQLIFSDGRKEWQRMTSAPYKRWSIKPDGKLTTKA